MHSESIQNPSLFSILLCCSLILQLFTFGGGFLINLHSVPHMTKWKQKFRNVCKFIKKKKLKYHIYISIQTLWGFSTPWLESTCGKLNWLGMIWKGTHLSIKGLTADNAYQSENQAMRSKEPPAELRDRIVSRHRSGEGYTKMYSALKVPKSTVASIILKWKKFGTTWAAFPKSIVSLSWS